MAAHKTTTTGLSVPKLVLMLSESWTLVGPRDPRALAELAAVAERAGADGILIGEHVAIGPETEAIGRAPNPREWVGPYNQSSRYPHPSPLHVLAAMAALTASIRLIASALLTPLRHPLVLGKELATLDLLSRGRLVVMPIPGSIREEYDVLGIPFQRRGAIFDEQLEIWEQAWREDGVTYHGEHFSFDDMGFEPKAWRPQGPTLWMGGNRLHARVLRRTVRYGSGYFPIFPPSDEELATLADELAAAGRSLSEIELVGFIGMGTPFPDGSGTKQLAPQLDAAVPEMARGTSTFVIKPSQYIDDPAQFGDFCREAVAGLRERAPH